ncbi:MAG: glycosyltransferase [Chitinophagaceae bacterium]|jgi:glycosyltransferase involved in cell wall biosynthesis|nr:MAG: glycosyltransferase [Chitinophagaceae bacterium]
MKIVILQGAFLPVPPVLGGAVEKIWFKIGKEFAALGNEVVHISRSWPSLPSEEMIEGVKHIRVKGFQTPSGMLKLKLLDLIYTIRAIRKIPSDADIVITNTFWAPIFMPKRKKQKIYVDVQRMPKGQMRFYRKAARLRANSSSVSNAIMEELKTDDLKQVVMIPNPLPFDVKKETEHTKKQQIILYAGRVHPEKGLDLLIQAVKKMNTDWVLKIVGPWDIGAGGGGDAYLARLKGMADGMKIEFVGPVFDVEKLNSYYEDAAIFVYPSVAEKGETFGLAPLEAMAWGCAPVVSNLTCFHDFIKNEENGLIFDHRSADAVNRLADAVNRLQQEEGLYQRLAQKALEVRKSHSSAAIAALFLEEFVNQLTNKK